MKQKSYRSIQTAMTGFALVLGFSGTSAESFDHGGMHRYHTPDGPAYLLPKILQMHPFDLNAQPVYGKPAGTLNIDKNGHAKLYFQNIEVPSMKDLDCKSSKILGTFLGPTGEDDNQAYYWNCDVLTFHASGPNLYHIDVQFADKEQHWKSYRVRGYQVIPEWISVE
jgi:hypothetical protein